jgi:glutathione S-transferase/predicted kinase
MPAAAKKPLVIVTRKLPDVVETRMRELFDARLNLEDNPMSQADIAEAMREADVLVPTITDHEPGDGGAPFSVFETGAILIYLAEKSGQLLSTDFRKRSTTLQWLIWQVSGLGPMHGQAHHFVRYAPEGESYGVQRYTKEARRLLSVMEYRLRQAEYLAEDYSIADIACWPFVNVADKIDILLAEYPAVDRWCRAIAERPAVVGAAAASERHYVSWPMSVRTMSGKESAVLMPADRLRPTLVVICGLPGSGKTTHARRLEYELPAVRFCPDEWMQSLGISLHDEEARERVEQFQWTVAKRLLSLGQSVLIEWGTWGRSERDRLRQEGQALGARVELHYLTAPTDVLLDRVQHRAMEEAPITRNQMERWVAQIQVPNEDEMKLFDRGLTLSECPAS